MRLFVDMDGTLAEWKSTSSLEDLYEKGYFLNLKPNQNLVDAIKLLTEEGYEIYILGAVLADSNYAWEEKKAWLDKYLPEIPKERRIFCKCGDNKSDYVPKGVRINDYLLDDYTVNLRQWFGTGIKFVNGINDTKGSFAGDRVYITDSPEKIADTLQMILNRGINLGINSIYRPDILNPNRPEKTEEVELEL